MDHASFLSYCLLSQCTLEKGEFLEDRLVDLFNDELLDHLHLLIGKAICQAESFFFLEQILEDLLTHAMKGLPCICFLPAGSIDLKKCKER